MLEEERTLDTLVTITRTDNGVVRGRHVYDPDLGLFRTRDDDVSVRSGGSPVPQQLPGSAHISYARSVRAHSPLGPLRPGRLHGAAGSAAILGGTHEGWNGRRGKHRCRATSERRRWQRARLGDRPSGGARMTPTAARRYSIFWPEWVSRDPAFRGRLDSMRIAAATPLTCTPDSQTRRIRRVRQHRRRAAHARLHERSGYVLLVQPEPRLATRICGRETTWPPALASDARRACTPAACRLLADQWRLAREPTAPRGGAHCASRARTGAMG